MADTIDDSRVKDVPVSASACNADDWFLIDGETSGTRKLSAANMQKKLTSDNAGVNISISTAGVIDVKNQNGYATNYSVALGTGCSAIGRWAFAHGYQTLASGANSYSHAEGSTTSAFGNNAHAEGSNTVASADIAHAEGSGTSALGYVSHSEGRATIASGQYSHAEGYATSAAGARSHAEGESARAAGQGSHAEGISTIASGNYSHAEGYMTSAVGSNSHAEGRYNVASVNGAHAEGYQTSAIGLSTHSEGEITIASGNESHAEGRETVAIGANSHAEGYQTSAVGERSHSEGNQTSAVGQYSHTEGYQTTAGQGYSHAEGRFTITDTQYQHVEGQYNAPATGALHVIGNGTSTANRSNIVETYTDRVVVNGDLINDTLSNFMFDNSQIATGTKTCVLKLDTNDWYCSTTAYTDYNKKYANIMSGENFNTNRSSGYTYPATIVCGLRRINNYPVGIVEWKGDISKICWNGPSTGGNKNYVSSWPATLPDTSYISTFERMYSENSYVSGPDTVPTDLLEKTSATTVGVPRIFQDCPRISGNWDAYVSTWSAKPTSGKINCFRGCTGIDNYATYTANSALSSMFLV